MNNFDKTIQDLLNGVDDSELETQDISEIPEMMPVVYKPKESSIENEDNPDLDEDYKFARSNLYGLLGKANAAIELTLKIAQMTESVKCIDTAAQIIQVSNNLTKSLLELQKQVKDSKKTTEKNKTVKNQTFIQNNYYSAEETEEVNSIIDQLDDLDE
jgi:hypothetical protein